MRTPTLALLAGLALAGCGETSRAPAGESHQAITGPSAETTAEREAKRAWREPGTIEVAEIDWARAETMPRADASGLPAQSRESVEGASLPVLLPRDPAMIARATITAGPTWYSAAMHGDGHHVTIHGTKQAVHQPALVADVPPERRRAPGETTITRTHGIVTVSFEAFGASYTIDVECERPMDDARCTEDAYAVSVFEGLGMAGGAQ